jgi:hypothetical protein
MATNAELAAELLRNSAAFFRDVGNQNPQLKEQMETNAETFEVVAGLVEKDPDAEMKIPEDAKLG